MKPRKQDGFSLIEVLISVLIGAMGVVAVMQLMVNNVRYTRSAYLQSIASNFARDMGERIQANKAAISTVGVSQYDVGTTPAQTASCRTTGCTPAEMAATDISEWQNAITAGASVISPDGVITPIGLPEGAGEVCIHSGSTISPVTATLTAANCDGNGLANPVTHVIRVHWTDNGDARALDYIVRVNPNQENGY